MESRTQRSRPRTQNKSEGKDSLFEGRPSRGQGQECSRPRPRTQAQVFSKKKVLKNFFQAISKKNVFKIFFLAFSSKKRLLKFFFRRSTNFQQFKKGAVLESRTANFRGLEASRSRTSKCVLEAKVVLEDSASVRNTRGRVLQLPPPLPIFFYLFKIGGSQKKIKNTKFEKKN